SKLVTSSNGFEIFAEGVGNLEGPTIILVHGLGSYTVMLQVRYDIRSHGRSGRPVDQSHHSSPKFAADFMTVVRD
ncbi:hypothetical protein F4604DRAFT_1501230, partial [Suillus subluteus]